MATDMYGEPSPVELFYHAFTKNVVRVWQAPNLSMIEQTKILVDTAHRWSHNIAFTPIKYQLAWKYWSAEYGARWPMSFHKQLYHGLRQT